MSDAAEVVSLWWWQAERNRRARLEADHMLIRCDGCGGTGWVDTDPPADAGAAPGPVVRRCPVCRGKGRIDAADAPPAPDPTSVPDPGEVARAWIAEGRRLLARPAPPPPAPPARPRKTSNQGEGGQSHGAENPQAARQTVSTGAQPEPDPGGGRQA